MWGHDLVDLLKELGRIIPIPNTIEINCKTLNLYYISTRYPDAFTSGYPAEKFSVKQAEDAIKLTKEVFKFASDRINQNRKRTEGSSQD